MTESINPSSGDILQIRWSLFPAPEQRDHSSLTKGRFLLGITFLGKLDWRRRNNYTRKLEEAVPAFRRGIFLSDYK